MGLPSLSSLSRASRFTPGRAASAPARAALERAVRPPMSRDALAAACKACTTHLYTISELSLNRPPMRPKVDRQSYDELKPVVDKALALLDWYNDLQKEFIAVLRELAGNANEPPAATLSLLAEALDCCIVLENQFGGWSSCINRFSWFKRTFTQIRREVSADIDADKLTRDISRFQAFIGARVCPRSAPLLARTRA